MEKGKETRKEGINAPWIEVMCRYLRGVGLALVVTLAVLLACAGAMSAGWLGEKLMGRCILVSCLLGGLLGGVVVSYGQRRALIQGVGTGALLFLVLMALGAIGYESFSVTNGGAGVLCACLCGGAIAGMLGRKRGKKRRR